MPAAKASFEIRYRASGGTTSVVSRSDDADAATVAFHSAMTQLRAAQSDGDVLLVKQEPGDRVVLRQRARRDYRGCTRWAIQRLDQVRRAGVRVRPSAHPWC